RPGGPFRPRSSLRRALRAESILDLPDARTVSSPHMSRPSFIAAIVLGSLALASPSPAGPTCLEHEIGLGRPGPASLDRRTSPPVLIDTIARGIHDKLGLPFSLTYKAYICDDETAFEEELLRD